MRKKSDPHHFSVSVTVTHECCATFLAIQIEEAEEKGRKKQQNQITRQL